MKWPPTAPVRNALRLAIGALISIRAIGALAPIRAIGALALPLVACVPAMAGGPPPITASAYGAFMAGTYAAQTGDKAEAAHYFAAALAQDPDNPVLLGQSFITALLAGSSDAASLAARLPGDPLAQMVRGNAAASAGHFAAAATHFAVLPDTGVTGLLRPLLLAWSEAGATEFGTAIERLKRADRGGSFGPIYTLNAALVADLAGREAEAATLYARARRSFAHPNLRLAQAFASFAARNGHPAQAAAILVQMAADHPDLRLALRALEKQVDKPLIATPREGLAEAYLTLAGTIDPRQQSLLRGILLDFALELRPHLAAARLLRANFEVEADKPLAAAATLAEIGTADPLYGPALLQRARILADRGHGAALLPALAALARAHPRATQPLAVAADIRRAAGDNQAAIVLDTEAIARAGVPAPQSAWSLYYGRAIAEDKAKLWPATEADLHRALALHPGQPFVLNYLGYSYALRGIHLAEAEAMIEQALTVDPNEGAIIDSLGYVLLREGKIQRAMREQIRAVRLAPTDPEVNAHLADIFAAAGDKLAAQHQWERALSLHPKPQEKARIEARLKHMAPAAGS